MLINAAVMKQSASQLEAMTRQASQLNLEEAGLLEGQEGAPTPASVSALKEPLLRHAAEKGIKGIKRTGLIYSPTKSWIAGAALVLFSLFVLAVTLATIE